METDRNEDLEFSRVWFLLRRRAWVPLTVAAIAALAAFVYSSSQTKLYRASAGVNVVDTAPSLYRSVTVDPTRDVANALYLLNSQHFQQQALATVNDPGKVQTITGSADPDTDVVTVEVVAVSPDAARDAVNGVADVFVAQQEQLNVQQRKNQAQDLRNSADDLNSQIAALDQTIAGASADEISDLRTQRGKLLNQQADLRTRANDLDAEAQIRSGVIRVVTPAETPSSPFEPKPMRSALVAGLVGLFLGVAAVIVYDWINNRVTSPEEASRVSGDAPVVGMIPLRGKRLRHRKLPASPRQFVEPDSPAEEAYRSLATNVRFSAVGRDSTTVAVSSPSEAEGKTTTVANLARSLAGSGTKVAIVSADLRRPSLGEIFGVEESKAGLTTVLLGEQSLADVAVSVDCGSGNTLLFLPSGPLPANPQAVLASDAMGLVLSRLAGAGADIILLDTAPILPVSDTLALAHHCDSFLLTVVPNSTKKTYLSESVKRLGRVGGKLLGISLDGVLESTIDYYGLRTGYYGGGYSGNGKVNGSEVAAQVPFAQASES